MCPETLGHQFSKSMAHICFCWLCLQTRVPAQKSAHLPQARIMCRVSEVLMCHLVEFDVGGLEQGTDRQETSLLDVSNPLRLS